jgi:sigma-54 dependent transcriptional regulator, acetoin dehydrogenase operon transcriptional activator AcoR
LSLCPPAAVPVHDPVNGELLGVVDISGPANTFNPQSLALAVSVGQHVESVLAQLIKQDHEKLLRHFLAKMPLWVNEDCLVLDRRGTIVHATEPALNVVRNSRHNVDNEAPTRFLNTVPFDQWPAKLKELLPNASLDLVKIENSGIGAIVLLHARRRLPAADRNAQRTGHAFGDGPTKRSSRLQEDTLRQSTDVKGAVGSMFVATIENLRSTEMPRRPATAPKPSATGCGNIRELRNMLARFTLAATDGLIDEAAVEAMIGQPPPKASGSLHDIQRASVLAVHAETAGNISETARRLGISRNTVYRAIAQNRRDDS